MRLIRAAAIQLTPTTMQESLEKAVGFIGVARLMGASVVCLPEAWFHHNPLSDVDNALTSYETIISKLSEAARSNGVWVVAGGLYSPEGPSIVSPVITPKGEISGIQKKVHLYRDEKKLFRNGKSFEIFDIEGVKAGIIICHDIVYPEAARTLVLKGAEILFNPSRITSEGCTPWRRYLEVRCLENRTPIIASNITIKNLYGGHSTIITVKENSRGIGTVETLAEGGDTEKVLIAEIDLDTPTQMRKNRISSRIPEAYEIN